MLDQFENIQENVLTRSPKLSVATCKCTVSHTVTSSATSKGTCTILDRGKGTASAKYTVTDRGTAADFTTGAGTGTATSTVTGTATAPDRTTFPCLSGPPPWPSW